MKPKIVLAGAVVIEIVMAALLFPFIDHPRIANTDFVNFYAAASIVRAGQGSTLYTRETQERALQAILGQRVAEYYLHPAFEAVALIPLTHLKIEHAFAAWTLMNLALVGLLPLLLAAYVPLIARQPGVGLLGFAFPPVLLGLALGQDSILVMFTISAAYLLLTRKRDFVGGLVLALATVKFQYVLILALLLLVARRFRLIAGFALGCSFLALVCILVTGHNAASQYFGFLRSFDQNRGYRNGRPATTVMSLPAFFEGLGADHFKLYATIGAILLLALGMTCSGALRRVSDAGLGFALFLAIALATTPYDHFQDVAILLPGIFLAVDAVVSGKVHGPRAKLLIVACTLLFLFPAVSVMWSWHYFWYSQVYLYLPTILLFVAVLAVELWPRNQGRTADLATTIR